MAGGRRQRNMGRCREAEGERWRWIESLASRWAQTGPPLWSLWPSLLSNPGSQPCHGSCCPLGPRSGAAASSSHMLPLQGTRWCARRGPALLLAPVLCRPIARWSPRPWGGGGVRGALAFQRLRQPGGTQTGLHSPITSCTCFGNLRGSGQTSSSRRSWASSQPALCWPPWSCT
jgi:hypothetical protein